MRRLAAALLVAAARIGAWALHLPCDHDEWADLSDD
jgi:hypothetical protein